MARFVASGRELYREPSPQHFPNALRYKGGSIAVQGRFGRYSPLCPGADKHCNANWTCTAALSKVVRAGISAARLVETQKRSKIGVMKNVKLQSQKNCMSEDMG